MTEIINQSTEWTSGSTHVLSDTLQVAAGATLTIDPGAVVSGGAIQVFGTLDAQGSAVDKVLFNNVNLDIVGSSGSPATMSIDNSIIQGGSFLAPTGNAKYGSFSLTNSTFRNVGGFAYVWYPTANDVITGNLFDGFGGFSIGTSGPQVLISHNTFLNINPPSLGAASTEGADITSWATYNNSQVIVDYNNFLDIGRPTLSLPSGYTSASMTATNNYFGTSDPAVITTMIFDKNDDLNSAGFISIAPILSSPDPTAPAPPTIPTVVGETASPGTADLGVGQTVVFTLTMSEVVSVTGGSPKLLLNDGGIGGYTSRSGTNALTFTYSVAARQNTPDLAVTGSSLNGATIVDAAGNAANLTGAVANPAGTLQIDTTPVTVSLAPGQVMLHAPASQYVVADDNGSVYVQDVATGGDGTQTLPNVNEMVFTNGVGVVDPTGTAADVARVYEATLGRAPDVAGLQYWTAQVDGSSVPLSAVASSFTTSPEFTQDYGSLSDGAFVNQLYQNVLGRPADAGGAQYWDGVLASGASRGAVVLGFAESQENKANTLSTAGDQNNAEAYRLYQAALNRAPDAAGQSYWSSTLANGATPTQVAQDFINSAEFQQDYGASSGSAFVSNLYQNVLHRAADPAGQQYWTNALQQGLSEASVLVGFSDSLENRVQTASATHANWVFIPS